MRHQLNKFPHQPLPLEVVQGDGVYLELANGKRVLDVTSGTTSNAVLGFSHPKVLDAMRSQMDKFCHVDTNQWQNPMLEDLAELLLSRAPKGMDKVYFCGNSGSEAIEAAMRLAHQVHYDRGDKQRQWFIAREQSYHGATLHAASVTDFPLFEYLVGVTPEKIAHIPQHNPADHCVNGEDIAAYTEQSVQYLESKILELGPENVCAFVGETMLGSLVGDVPPAPGYWQGIREVCDRYGVFLILDEVYCGLGRSGQVYCCDLDGITPDFVCVGKNLGAGYAPLSAVVTDSNKETAIANGSGRVMHGHTYQGYALGAAAALAVQQEVHTDTMLNHIASLGEHIAATLQSELGEHAFFRNVRGRGLLQSISYDCAKQPEFSVALQRQMFEDHDILINAKWHRTSLTPAYTFDRETMDRVLELYIETFKSTAQGWSS